MMLLWFLVAARYICMCMRKCRYCICLCFWGCVSGRFFSCCPAAFGRIFSNTITSDRFVELGFHFQLLFCWGNYQEFPSRWLAGHKSATPTKKKFSLKDTLVCLLLSNAIRDLDDFCFHPEICYFQLLVAAVPDTPI